jgi:hypothetical protein
MDGGPLAVGDTGRVALIGRPGFDGLADVRHVSDLRIGLETTEWPWLA